MIRYANEADITAILTELRQFAKHYGTKLSLFPRDDEKAHAVVANLVKRHLFFVADEGGHITGLICGLVSENIFNPEIIALNELLFWVTPGRRFSRVASELLRAYIAWGEKHCHWVTMVIEDQSFLKPWTLSKRGFKLKEQTYLLEVNHDGKNA